MGKSSLEVERCNVEVPASLVGLESYIVHCE
jgi:hypothetical protein